MNTKGFIGLVLIAGCALGAGYWMGRHGSTSAGPAPTAPDSTARAGAPLPPVKVRRTAVESGPAEKPGSADRKLSLADIEAKIQGMREGDRRYSREWQKIIDSVASADIPQMLAAVEKTPSRSTRDGLRIQFLSRWAESDPAAAMTYANSVAGKQPREQAIMSVLRGWSEKDPDGAAALDAQLVTCLEVISSAHTPLATPPQFCVVAV